MPHYIIAEAARIIRLVEISAKLFRVWIKAIQAIIRSQPQFPFGVLCQSFHRIITDGIGPVVIG